MKPTALPNATRPFVAFATLLRANGFAVAPEQTTAFMSAITVLGPRSLDDIRRAARATRRVVGSAEGGDAFAGVDERDAVARALARLPERQRAAIVLTELLGYDSVEAGRILGVKDVTVRSLASQARATLRTDLEDRDE